MSKGKKISLILGLALGLAGVVLLFFGFKLLFSTRSFIKTATETNGEVIRVDLSSSTDTDSSGNRSTSTNYRPVVNFTTSDGQDITFASSVASNPSPYEVGDKVTVLYNPLRPHDAKIKSFVQLWIGTLIVGGLGILFTLIGLLISFFVMKSFRLKKWLLQNGQALDTDYQNCEINSSITINGSNPYVITSQWKDPTTNTTYVFKSEDIWYNPKEFLAGKKIKVLVDPKNYKRYYMDISGLPKAS